MRPNSKTRFYGSIPVLGLLLAALLSCEAASLPGGTAAEASGTEVHPGSFEVSPALRIAHAGGGINGESYTNSREAIELNLGLGFEFFELDFIWTSDNVLVTLHDWKGNAKRTFGFMPEQVPDVVTFKSWVREHSNYENLTLDELAQLMRENKDFILVTDVKDFNRKALRQMLAVLPDARERVIPQIYKPHEYADVSDMGFRRIIWSLYRFSGDTPAVLKNLREMELFAVTMPKARAEQGLAKTLAELGLPTYVHTINSDKKRIYFQEQQGVTEIYTDFLAP